MEKRLRGKPGNEFLGQPVSTIFVSSDIEKMFSPGYKRADFIREIFP
ncbi:MAG: hypothetical protein ACOYUB_01985 [Patescibacteria group bacterium]